MTEVLQKAFEEASKLPVEEQKLFASFLLAELESDRKWDDLFARSQDQLGRLADEAVREDSAGISEDLIIDRP